MTIQDTLVLVDCPSCGDKVSQDRVRFVNKIGQSEMINIRGIVCSITSSELFYHIVLNCQNCPNVSIVKSIPLN